MVHEVWLQLDRNVPLRIEVASTIVLLCMRQILHGSSCRMSMHYIAISFKRANN